MRHWKHFEKCYPVPAPVPESLCTSSTSGRPPVCFQSTGCKTVDRAKIPARWSPDLSLPGPALRAERKQEVKVKSAPTHMVSVSLPTLAGGRWIRGLVVSQGVLFVCWRISGRTTFEWEWKGPGLHGGLWMGLGRWAGWRLVGGRPEIPPWLRPEESCQTQSSPAALYPGDLGNCFFLCQLWIEYSAL